MPSFSVSRSATHELLPAMRLLFGDDAPDVGDRDDTGVFVARDAAGRVRGAVLVQVLPGALGVVCPPRAELPADADALMGVACGWLKARGVKVCQAFATARQVPDTAALVGNGFRRVTQLVSMRRQLPLDAPSLPDAGSALAFWGVAPPFSHEFLEALLATHDGTLDCPELNGERTSEELLAGLTEPTPGTAWYLATEGERAVGVAILVAGLDEVELSYLGVVPSARNRGVGGELLRFVLGEAGVSVAVSVDARNEPALRLYRRHGFVETERREVFLLQFPISEL